MRRMLPIILGRALLTAAFVAAPQVDHATAQQPAPVIRIQLVIERVHVLDDKDALTGGELTYRFRLQRGSESCRSRGGFWCTGAGELFITSVSRSASTGDVLSMNRVLGGADGLALYLGDQFRYSFAGVEEDWDGLGVDFCPLRSATHFDDTMCGAHDRLGIVDLASTHPYDPGGGYTESVTVRNTSGEATFRVDFRLRRAVPPPVPTPSPLVPPVPSPRPGDPPRHQP